MVCSLHFPYNLVLNNTLFERTSGDKLQLAALHEIAKLSPLYLLDIHGDFMKCNCIPKLQDKLDDPKVLNRN